MSGRHREVTVLIPTLGRGARAALLADAVGSVLSQEGVRVRLVVIINGPYRSAEVEQWLRANPRIEVVSLAAADLPGAFRAGRALVDTPWFTALDDDDFLLPGALERRVRELEEHPGCSVVVTNGYRREDGADVLHMDPRTDVSRDPLRALLERNWVLPGSWLCRTDGVDEHLFDGMPRFLECTFLGVRFSTGYRLRWIGEPTLVYRVASPMAESQTRAYTLGQVEALRRILDIPMPSWARRKYRRRVAEAYHSASMREWKAGAVAEAWRWHLSSLTQPGGLRYLPYTRHLVRALWRGRGP